MAQLIRYKPLIRGIKRLRGSRQIDHELERRAYSIAVAAESGYAALGKHVPVEVVQADSDTGEPRARVAVIARSAAAIRIEADHRILGGSLDAAR